MYAGRIGEMIGALAIQLLIAYAILAVNRKRLDNPTPYLAAGIGALLIASLASTGGSQDPWTPTFLIWGFLLWRFKRNAHVPPSGLARMNAIWLAFLAILALWALAFASDASGSVVAACVGAFSIACGVLWKWVRRVPLTRTEGP